MKNCFVIVNRTFWPQNQMLGEALLKFSESLTDKGQVWVVSQSKGRLKKKLNDAGRGKGVGVMDCRAFSDSSTGLITRFFDAIFFSVWSFISLIRIRPNKVYISTDPPVLVPFIVYFYCKIFRAKYIYHLQDIHPEIASIILPMNKFVFKLLRGLDNIVMRNASSMITISNEMKNFIKHRSKTTAPIYLVSNPGINVSATVNYTRSRDIVFCGNLGRLQKIPLLLSSIKSYLNIGGALNFHFVGAGVYSEQLSLLADECDSVKYYGYLHAEEAAKFVKKFSWAILPIDNSVNNYAFPSKSSSYLLSGCAILAICDKDSAVGKWVNKNKLGLVSQPTEDCIVESFNAIEKSDENNFIAQESFLDKFQIEYFVKCLKGIVCDQIVKEDK